MMKTLLSLLVLIFPLVTFAGYLKVSPGEIFGFKYLPEEKERLLKSFTIIEKVINSQEFKDAVIGYPGYTSTDLSNQEIYDFLLSGNELLGGEETLGFMNFDVARYWSRWPYSRVRGRSSPGYDNWIEVNGRHYKDMNSAEMAGNITHEWIHLTGFYHVDENDTQSVPYAVGYMMEELALKYLSQGFLN